MQTGAYFPHYLNVFFGEGTQRTKSFSVQQGDYGSREVVCSQYTRFSDGRNSQMSLDNVTVTVVYDKDNGSPSPEYATEKVGEGKVSFVIPKSVQSTYGDAEQQLRLYSEERLLHSAILPFMIKKSISPSTLPDEDDVQPAMLVLLQQVEETMKNAAKAEEERVAAELEREKRFAEFEEIIGNIEAAGQQVFNANTRYDFPSVGSVNVIYKAEKERQLYQWNSDEQKYETLNESDIVLDITIINGGDANG